MKEMMKNQRPLGPGKPPRHMTYTWWTPPKRERAMEQRRMTPPRNSPSTGVSGAAQNPANTKTAIPAREIIILRRVPRKTPSSKIQHRRMEKPILMRERQTERSRI